MLPIAIAKTHVLNKVTVEATIQQLKKLTKFPQSKKLTWPEATELLGRFWGLQ